MQKQMQKVSVDLNNHFQTSAFAPDSTSTFEFTQNHNFQAYIHFIVKLSEQH